MSFKHVLRVIKQKIIIRAKIYFRYPLNVLMIFVMPLIWLTPQILMAKGFGGTAGFKEFTGSDNYVGFMVIGFMIAVYSSNTMWSIGYSLKEEMWDGVLESNWTTPVNRIVLVLANAIFEFITATFQVILVGVICRLAFNFNVFSKELLKCIIFLIPFLFSLMGLGLIVASLVLIIKNENTVIDVSDGIIQGFSGSTFPIEVLPRFLLPISFIIPLTYMNNSARVLIIGETPFMDLKYEFLILVISMFVFLFLGILTFNKVEKKCRQEGLSGY
ncbi:ABC transporter permease [Clostridium sp. CTA-19]